MFCDSCQSVNREGNLFCTACGERLAASLTDRAEDNSRYDARRDPDSTSYTGLSPDERGLTQKGDWTPPESYWPAAGNELVHQGPVTLPVSPWPPVPGVPVSAYRQASPVLYRGIEPFMVRCARCGLPRATRLDSCPHCGRVIVNNSGSNAMVPAELASGWNWGAFAFPVLWSLSHESWMGLLGLVPGLNLFVGIVLAARGNEIAWQHRRFRSPEHFQEVQRIWSRVGVASLLITLAFLVIMCSQF